MKDFDFGVTRSAKPRRSSSR